MAAYPTRSAGPLQRCLHVAEGAVRQGRPIAVEQRTSGCINVHVLTSVEAPITEEPIHIVTRTCCRLRSSLRRDSSVLTCTRSASICNRSHPTQKAQQTKATRCRHQAQVLLEGNGTAAMLREPTRVGTHTISDQPSIHTHALDPPGTGSEDCWTSKQWTMRPLQGTQIPAALSCDETFHGGYRHQCHQQTR